jgi:hypothetical protein
MSCSFTEHASHIIQDNELQAKRAYVHSSEQPFEQSFVACVRRAAFFDLMQNNF